MERDAGKPGRKGSVQRAAGGERGLSRAAERSGPRGALLQRHSTALGERGSRRSDLATGCITVSPT